MGFPPPPDLPTPAEQDAVTASASFEPSPSGPTLCGFGIPQFAFNFNVSLPFPFPPPGFPPKLSFGLALNCDLSNPFDAEFEFGGGRVSTSDPDTDSQFEDG